MGSCETVPPDCGQLFGQEFLSSPQARVIWAKSGDGNGHGLLTHLLDVAAVAEAILDMEPASSLRWVATRMGVSAEHAKRWVAAVAGLHDFGKAIPGFQAKWPQGMQTDIEQGLTFPVAARKVDNHSCATAALLEPVLRKITGAQRDWLRAVVRAIGAHHGYHFLPNEINDARPVNEPEEWAEARKAILDIYWRLLAPKGVPERDELDLPVISWLAGLTSTADWIASNPEWFPQGERGHACLADYFSHAIQLAHDALRQVGWRPMQPFLKTETSTEDLLARLVGSNSWSVRPLQQIGDLLLQGATGPSLLLVEAPMGEGKTELAFLAHLRLQARNGHRGLYVALPTQATGNAMFRRFLTFLSQFADNPMDVQLVHGGASMNDDLLRLRDIDQSHEATLSASIWFSQRRRPLLSPYGVGTVDQALLATLNVKHHFVRLWGLGNRVVVLDEIHAYDTYTTGLITTLLQWLKALGSSVILMSATLPRLRRDELMAAWGVSVNQVPDIPYPRVLLVDDVGVRGNTFSSRALPPIQLHGLGETVEALGNKVVELLGFGGCGAVIVNTVERAQMLHRLLREHLKGDDVELLLFHARFPADERREHEDQVLARFGLSKLRPKHALLIATQVAEQSLDIDFDFMLSDLAPVDLLLQRAGRLHRHSRSRPEAHAQARLWVAGLTPEFPDLKKTAWGFVYDPYILGRTWAKLGQETVLQLPNDIERLVQWVYGDDPLPEGLQEAVQNSIEIESYGQHLAKEKRERQLAMNITLDCESALGDAYREKPRGNEEGDDLRNKTRLGRDTVTLIPVEVVKDGWQVDETVFHPNQLLGGQTVRKLYNRQIKVSKTAVVKHFQLNEYGQIPASFAENALLRHMYPLVLVDGCCRLGNLNVMLDRELGLVFEPRNPENGVGA